MARAKGGMEEFDWHLLGVAAVLTLIGLTFVWSTTQSAENTEPLVGRQLLYVVASLFAVALVARLPYPVFARLAGPAYVLTLLFLAWLLFKGGDGVRKTQSWVRLPFGFSLQPAEFCKIAVILALATWFRHREAPRRWRDLGVPFALTAVPFVLVAKQPDLGSASILIPVLFALLFCAGARLGILATIVLAAGCLAVALYFSPLLKEYQRARIDSYFRSIPEQTQQVKKLRSEGNHAAADQVERQLRALKQNENFQVYHAMISIGSGGLFGKGIGKGPHNHLDYLPERHNDFIFAVIGEEWGFLGSSIVLGLYVLLIALVLGVGRRTRDPFGRLLCGGIAAMFGAQILLNTGVATGIVPVTGVTLPFLSFGGSSMLASFIALAIVLSVGAHRVTVLHGGSYDERVFGEGGARPRKRRR